jgi:hypothetical protein
MAGFTSQDDLINQITTNSKFYRADWNKLFNPTAAAVAGEWHSLARGAGSPQADALFNTGTNLVHQQVFDITTSGGGMYHGGNVGATGADYKTVLNASAFSAAATTMPAVAMLVDILAFVRVTTVTTITAQTVINSNTFTASSSSGLLLTYTNDFQNYSKVRFTNSGGALPTGLSAATDYWLIRVSATTARVATTFTNAIAGTAIAFTDAGTGTHTVTMRLPRYSDGAGVQAFMFNSNATALGAGTPNLTLPSYTNAAGTASRVTPALPSPPIGKTGATNSHILYSGATGTGKMGPFLPLQSGDAGIQSIQQVQNSTSYVSGEYTVAMAKPILTLPMTTLGVAAEREFVSQLPSFPRVYDGAALYWLLYSGAATPANSAFYGHVDFGWS